MKKLLLLSTLALMAPSLAHAQMAVPMALPKSMQHKGSVDGGLTMARGNTKTDNLNANVSLTSTLGQYSNTLTGRAINLKQNSQRSDEDYLVNNKLKYNINPSLYGFGELEYFNDRYAGFEQRTNELAGLGYFLRNDENVKVSVEGGAGARQTKYTGNTLSDQNEFLAKAGGNVFYKFNNAVDFNQDVNYFWGDSLQVTRAQSSLKAAMTDDMYFKASYLIENNSDVPLGKKNNDQLTMFGVGYEFGE